MYEDELFILEQSIFRKNFLRGLIFQFYLKMWTEKSAAKL